jgi:hypothetical protein
LAQAELGGQSDAYINTVAAYMTLGSFGHQTFITDMTLAFCGVELDPGTYQNAASSKRQADRDLDGDLVSNLEEWERAPANAPAGMDPAEFRVQAFVSSVLDPAQPGEALPVGAKSARKAGPGTDEPCPNADCIGTVKILLQNGEHCSVTGTYGDGQTISAGEETDVPLGTRVTIETECGDRFVAWHAPGTMADGSGEASETFTVTQAQTGANAIKALERTEATVTVLQGGTAISTQTALWGDPVHIAPGGFKVGSDYDPGRTLASEATVLAGIGDTTIELEGMFTLSSQRLVHTIESEGGGRVILAEGGDPDAAAFLNTAVSSRANQPVAPWRRVVFRAIPDVGYFPQYPLESLAMFGHMERFLHDSYSPVRETIAFSKMYELTLIALPEGGGNPECVGYIKAQQAKKYYGHGEEVQLTAIGQPGYTFSGWRGSAWGWLPDESEEDSFPIEWLAASSIIIKMEHTYTVIAEFTPPGEVVSSIESDSQLLPKMNSGDLIIPPAIENETATILFINEEPGAEVTASIEPVGEAKGHHEYAGRHDPVARLGHLGSLSASTSSGAGNCSVYQWTLTPSEFSGDYRVKIEVDGTPVHYAPFTVKVSGLMAVEASESIELSQSTESYRHIHTDQYRLTSGFKGIIESIAAQYHNQFPSAKMYLNDCSVPWGGRFEYPGHWTDGSHERHRRGLESDINKVGSSAQVEWLESLIRNTAGIGVDHEDNPHWHVQPPSE